MSVLLARPLVRSALVPAVLFGAGALAVALPGQARANAAFCADKPVVLVLAGQPDRQITLRVAEVPDPAATEATGLVFDENSPAMQVQTLPGILPLTGGKCYNIALPASPSASGDSGTWGCTTMLSSSLEGLMQIDSYYMVADGLPTGQAIPTKTGSLQILGDLQDYNASAPVMNCP